MSPDEIREKFNSVTVWKKGGERAPHKPLLALYAIGRVPCGEPRMVPCAQVDRDLGKCSLSSVRGGNRIIPEYLFWRLQNDEVWFPMRKGWTPPGNADATKRGLLEHDVSGGFHRNCSRSYRATSDLPVRLFKTCWSKIPNLSPACKRADTAPNEWINKIQGLWKAVAPYCPVENHLRLLASKNNPV